MSVVDIQLLGSDGGNRTALYMVDTINNSFFSCRYEHIYEANDALGLSGLIGISINSSNQTVQILSLSAIKKNVILYLVK